VSCLISCVVSCINELSRLSVVQRASFEDMNCSIAQSLEIVGEWWTLLIVRESFLGVRRFDDFQERLGISRNVLTQRLAKLVDAGILERVQYSERPPRDEYRLTEKGVDLWPVLTTLRQWGDRWATPPAGPPTQMVHKTCGEVASAQMVCSECGEPLDARSVRATAGPGADDEIRALLDRTRPR
jgi:DNA-binding HxlR family transcriptional regulator